MRFVQSRGRLTRDESGRPRRMFGMVQDITERKRAEAERTATRGTAASGREDGSDRPLCERHRARLQQRARRNHRLRRDALRRSTRERDSQAACAERADRGDARPRSRRPDPRLHAAASAASRDRPTYVAPWSRRSSSSAARCPHRLRYTQRSRTSRSSSWATPRSCTRS